MFGGYCEATGQLGLVFFPNKCQNPLSVLEKGAGHIGFEFSGAGADSLTADNPMSSWVFVSLVVMTFDRMQWIVQRPLMGPNPGQSCNPFANIYASGA